MSAMTCEERSAVIPSARALSTSTCRNSQASQGIEARKWFIEKQDWSPGTERQGQRHLCLLAT